MGHPDLLLLGKRHIAEYTDTIKSCEAVVWWTTPVEIASALARLVRMKQLNSSDSAKACKLATALADAWSVIQPPEAVRASLILTRGERDDVRHTWSDWDPGVAGRSLRTAMTGLLRH